MSLLGIQRPQVSGPGVRDQGVLDTSPVSHGSRCLW